MQYAARAKTDWLGSGATACAHGRGGKRGALQPLGGIGDTQLDAKKALIHAVVHLLADRHDHGRAKDEQKRGPRKFQLLSRRRIRTLKAATNERHPAKPKH